ETRQPLLYAVFSSFLVLSTLAVILRFISRSIARVGQHRDDIFIVIGWALYMAFIGVAIGDVKTSGLGLHQALVNPEMMQSWAKYVLAVAFLYVFSVVFPKIAVLSLYLSIFTRQRISRIICYVIGGLIVGNCLGCAGAAFALCIPLESFWNPQIHGRCFDMNSWFRYARVINILSDIVLLVLPLPHVYHLQSPTRLKIGVLVTFLTGSLGLIASLITLFEFSRTNAVSDSTWTGALLILWAIIETGMYLIAACMISYPPLIKYIWKGLSRRPKG
ncbi:uncharacterized protein BO97DRAFT_326969, partial [Aspergillus homomorphus CBS 101889]